MIVNPDEFKSVILTKNIRGFSISADIVSMEKSVNILGVHQDNCFNLKLHVNTIGKSA